MVKGSCELAFDAFPGQAGGALARNHDDIRAWPHPSAATAKELADLSLDPIANHRVSNFAADSNPQSRLGPVVRAADDDETRRLKLRARTREF